jgi:hypothetical protein
VNEFYGKRSTEKEPDVIICPHCGHAETRTGDSIYLVHALSDEEEADFNKAHPLESEDSQEDMA